MHPDPFDFLFAGFAFFLGAAIGSFLNVCIYRMPRDMSVNEPKRSFCPSCQYQIPWHCNLPLASWLLLRGKCANCGATISFRYFGVELLTAFLFLAVWLVEWPHSWILALPYWILMSLFVVATFVDFEFFEIPDQITKGGTVAGLLLSLAIPLLHQDEIVSSGGSPDSNLLGALWGLIGAAAGFSLLWVVVELGKLAFGKKKLRFKEPQKLLWVRDGDDADLTVGELKDRWSDFFARGHEELRMKCVSLEVSGEKFTEIEARWTLEWLHVGDRKWELNKTDSISGEVTEVVFPREAMGFGDVKFLACIGAFLGWKAVLFTVGSASCLGSIVGVFIILARKREWSAKIPFGPYLAVGALTWLFAGPQIIHWYWAHIVPSEP